MVDLVPFAWLVPVVEEHVLPGLGAGASDDGDVFLGFDVWFAPLASIRSQFRLERYALSAATASTSHSDESRFSSWGESPAQAPVTSMPGYGFENTRDAGVKLEPVTCSLPLGSRLEVSPARVRFGAEARGVYGYASFPLFNVSPT